MSWGLSVSQIPVADFDAAVDALQIPSDGVTAPAQELLDQLAAAKLAAKAIADSKAVCGDHFNASLSGHSDTAAGGGTAQDFVSVNVYQAPAPVPPPGDAAPPADTPPVS